MSEFDELTAREKALLQYAILCGADVRADDLAGFLRRAVECLRQDGVRVFGLLARTWLHGKAHHGIGAVETRGKQFVEDALRDLGGLARAFADDFLGPRSGSKR